MSSERARKNPGLESERDSGRKAACADEFLSSPSFAAEGVPGSLVSEPGNAGARSMGAMKR